MDNPETAEHPVVTVRTSRQVTPLPHPRSPSEFGISPSETHPALQTDVYKEIVNKIAWCLGSVYRVPYAGKRTAVRIYAERVARAVVRDHGYPVKIAKG